MRFIGFEICERCWFLTSGIELAVHLWYVRLALSYISISGIGLVIHSSAFQWHVIWRKSHDTRLWHRRSRVLLFRLMWHHIHHCVWNHWQPHRLFDSLFRSTSTWKHFTISGGTDFSNNKENLLTAQLINSVARFIRGVFHYTWWAPAMSLCAILFSLSRICWFPPCFVQQ